MPITRRQLLLAAGTAAIAPVLSSSSSTTSTLQTGIRQPSGPYRIKAIALGTAQEPVSQLFLQLVGSVMNETARKYFADSGLRLLIEPETDVEYLSETARSTIRWDALARPIATAFPARSPITKYVFFTAFNSGFRSFGEVDEINGNVVSVDFNSSDRELAIEFMAGVVEHELVHSFGGVHTCNENDLMSVKGGASNRLHLGYTTDPQGQQATENTSVRRSKWANAPDDVLQRIASFDLPANCGERLSNATPVGEPLAWVPVPTFKEWTVEYQNAALWIKPDCSVELIQGQDLRKWRQGTLTDFPDRIVAALSQTPQCPAL